MYRTTHPSGQEHAVQTPTATRTAGGEDRRADLGQEPGPFDRPLFAHHRDYQVAIVCAERVPADRGRTSLHRGRDGGGRREDDEKQRKEPFPFHGQ